MFLKFLQLTRNSLKPKFRQFISSGFCTKSDKKGGKEDCNEEKPKKEKAFRHNYCEEVEAAVNSQILSEFNASMTYLSMACYYGRTDVALPGCQLFFKSMYQEEQTHALDFINYQLMRGGVVQLHPITVPENNEWHDIIVALAISMEMEKRVKEKLEILHCLANDYEEIQLVGMVEDVYIKEQNLSICEMGRLLTRAKRLIRDGGGVGRHLFDRHMFEYVTQKHPNQQFDVKSYF